MKNRLTPIRFSVSMLCLSVSMALHAQEDESTEKNAGLEVIEVRAQKRVEPLQETPIAVTAFTPNALDRKGIDDISKLASFSPNLVFDTQSPIGGASSAAAVFIRGIGNTDFSLTTDPGVGTYVDGIYVSRSIGGVLDVLDVSGIEVLRGPQGTLFGRNTIGGAINITSRKPYDEVAGSVQLTLGNFDRRDFRGSIDIPFSDTFFSTFAVSKKDRDGYVDRVLVGDTLGGQDRLAFRGSFFYEPSEKWNFQLSFDLTDYDDESAPGVAVGFTATEFGAGTSANSILRFPELSIPEAIDAGIADLQQFVVGEDVDVTFADGENFSTVDAEGYSFIASYLGDNFEIKYIGSLRETEATFASDSDNAPFQITSIINPDYDVRQISHELQITGDVGRFKYVGGIYQFDEEGEDNVFVPLALVDPSFSVAFEAALTNLALVDNGSEAYYFQGTWAATDQLNITGGVRHTIDDKEFNFSQFVGGNFSDVSNGVFDINPLPFFPGAVTRDGTFEPGLLPLIGNGSGVSNDTFEETTYKFGADYILEGGTLLYYSFSQGFKSGGFVNRYVAPVPEPLAFDPELLDSHEIGVKWENDSKRLRINGALFYNDYSEIQVTFFDTLGGPVTANAGEATIQGLELEVNALLTSDLLFEFGYGYIDAEYTSVNEVPGLALAITEDSALVNTPEHTVNASLEYRKAIGDNEIAARLDYTFTDDIFNDSQNSPFLFQDANSIVNASVTYTINYDLDVVLFASNLTDRRIIESGNSNFGLGFHEARFNRPREYGVTVRYKF
jgi:iron complex outermembrane receptor protein